MKIEAGGGSGRGVAGMLTPAMAKAIPNIVEARRRFWREHGQLVLRAIRKARLTQAEVARRAGLHAPALSMAINGQRSFALDDLEKIAKALDAPVEQLMLSADEPAPAARDAAQTVDPVLASFIERHRQSIAAHEEKVLVGAASSRERGTDLTDQFLMDLLRIIKKHGIGLPADPAKKA